MEPVIPDYDGACITRLVGELMAVSAQEPSPERGEMAAWLPACVREASQVALLVVDGLGFNQMQRYSLQMPFLRGLEGGMITSVAPSTTAAALTSMTTGAPPSRHGITGYRMRVSANGGPPEILNTLRWSTERGDARRRFPPPEIQSLPPFPGAVVPVLTKPDFAGTGFTAAHLRGMPHIPYRMPSSLPVDLARVLAAGEKFVYLYYDGVDRVAHACGLDDHFRAELAAADRLAGDLAGVLPGGAVLVIAADHGQVEVDAKAIELDPALLALVEVVSGEGRFRWLHAAPGAAAELLSGAAEAYGDAAWVVSRGQIVEEGWFGGEVPDVAPRLGDVALVAREAVAFMDPADQGENRLRGRHGSLTEDEMFVPCLAYRRDG